MPTFAIAQNGCLKKVVFSSNMTFREFTKHNSFDTTREAVAFYEEARFRMQLRSRELKENTAHPTPTEGPKLLSPATNQLADKSAEKLGLKACPYCKQLIKPQRLSIHIKRKCPKNAKRKTFLKANARRRRLYGLPSSGKNGLKSNWPSFAKSGHIVFFEGGLPSLGKGSR
jgi:hypothetical protein